MQMTPNATVIDRLFVHSAINIVGIIASSTCQSILIKCGPSLMKLSTIKAEKMHTGIKVSHLLTISGIWMLRTNMNGNIRGMTVTRADPRMIR